MKTNRVLLFSLITGLMSTFANTARAEDCVWAETTYRAGKAYVGAYYICYTDSLHTTLVSKNGANLYLPKNDGWRLDTSTGNIYNTNDSSVSYTINTAPKLQEFSYEYYSDGTTIKSSVSKTYTSYGAESYYYKEENNENGQHIHTETRNKDLPTYVNDYEYNDDGQQIKGIYKQYDSEGNMIVTVVGENYYDGEIYVGSVSETHDGNGKLISKSTTENHYDENKNYLGYESYDYDENGNITYQEVDKYTLDADGNVLSVTSSYGGEWENGKLTYEYVNLYKGDWDEWLGYDEKYYTYDQDGNLIGEEIYTYDTDDNQIGFVRKAYNADGSYSVYGENGEKIGTYNADGSKKMPKRIYTISEATAAVKGNRNTFSIRYR